MLVFLLFQFKLFIECFYIVFFLEKKLPSRNHNTNRNQFLNLKDFKRFEMIYNVNCDCYKMSTTAIKHKRCICGW